MQSLISGFDTPAAPINISKVAEEPSRNLYEVLAETQVKKDESNIFSSKHGYVLPGSGATDSAAPVEISKSADEVPQQPAKEKKDKSNKKYKVKF